MESNVNIFQSAYFGKAYKTRDGRKAIYIQEDCCIVEGNRDVFSYFDDGHFSIPLEECDIDIVSEWQEPIDKDKLDKITIEEKNKYKERLPFYYEFPHSENDLNIRCIGFIDGFKAGYYQGWNDKK